MVALSHQKERKSHSINFKFNLYVNLANIFLRNNISGVLMFTPPGNVFFTLSNDRNTNHSFVFYKNRYLAL